MMYLKEPSIDEKDRLIDMCNEFNNCDDIYKFEGIFRLENLLTLEYENWLEQIEIDKHIEDVNPDWSNATSYVLMDEFGHVYGFCSLRHHLQGNLINIGGNIGYGIRPTERGKGYGTVLLKLLLEKAKEIGLNKVLLTCRENNDASRRLIEKFGGIKDYSVSSKIPGIMELRYWIDIK